MKFLIVLLFAACSCPPVGPENPTYRDVAYALCDAFCERVVECDDRAELDECLPSCTAKLCPDCVQPFVGEWSDVESCLEEQSRAACPITNTDPCAWKFNPQKLERGATNAGEMREVQEVQIDQQSSRPELPGLLVQSGSLQ